MLTSEQLAELQKLHGRIEHLKGAGDAWECVFKKPDRGAWKRFRQLASKPDTQSEAQEMLALACVVYPSREAFDSLLNDYPAIPEACAGRLGALAGIALDESSKA